MKQPKILKTLSLFMVVVAYALALASCSSEDDERDLFIGPIVNTECMIPYSDLPGTWLIESIKDAESGVVTKINQKVTFADFSPIMSSTPVREGSYRLWGHVYHDMLSYDGQIPDEDGRVNIHFCTKLDEEINSALIDNIGFDTSVETGKTRINQSFFLMAFRYSGKSLKVLGVYDIEISGVRERIDGYYIMKKL